MTPLELAQEVAARYRRYLETTFYFRDPELRRSFAAALARDEIWKGPYLEATPNFRRGATTAQVFRKHTNASLDPGFLAAIDGDRRLYQHQIDAIERVASGRNVIVATGTGSGKTECFLYPILLALLEQHHRGELQARPGIRALILYPMNALAYDQRQRLGDLCRGLERHLSAFRFTFGQYTGATPENERDSFRHAEEVLRHRHSGELITREEMRRTPPHILLTNYSMLEYQLLRPTDSPLFDAPFGETWTFLVLDEVHQYRGTRGAEMALLLRRLKQRLHDAGAQGPFRCIGTSATLAGGPDDCHAVAAFAQALFDEPFEPEDIILADQEEIPDVTGPALPASCYTLLNRVLETDHHSCSSTVSTLRQAGVDVDQIPGIDGRPSEELVGLVLEQDARLSRLRRKLVNGAVPFDELATALFPELPNQDRARTLADMVGAACKARRPDGGGPLLSVRYHGFVRALEGAFIRFTPKREILLAPQGSGDEGVTFELALCRECGQHYVVGRVANGKLVEAIRDPSQADFGATFFMPIEEPEQTFQQEEINEETGERHRLCVRCGALAPVNEVLYCGHDEVILVEQQTNAEREVDQLAKCAACGYRGQDPVREVIHGGDGPHAVIVTTLFQNTVQEPKKILAFADSRQEAAYFAWYLEHTYQGLLRRSTLYQVIHELSPSTEEGLSPADLAHQLTQQAEAAGLVEETASQRERTRTAWTIVYDEFLAQDTRLSLSGVGLIKWKLKWPAGFELPRCLKGTPLNLTDDEAWSLLYLLVNSLRHERAVELTGDSQNQVSWSDLDIFGSQRIARLGPPGGDKNVTSWNGANVWRTLFLKRLLSHRGVSGSEVENLSDQILREVWKCFTQFSDSQSPGQELLIRVADGRRLNPRWYRARAMAPDELLFRCDTCGRTTTFSIGGICTRYGCRGTLVPTDASRINSNHYRMLYESAWPGQLKVEEHTAQLVSDQAREIQRAFQDGRIHVLSCSTTFELGVDLGELNTVFLRNVPPEPFNYAQRVGRTGRRPGRPGFSLTYCRRGPHDLYHFAHPERMLSGRTSPPSISLKNIRIAERHLTAVVLSAFFRTYPDRFKTVAEFVGDWEHPRSSADVAEFLTNNICDLTPAFAQVFPESLQDELHLSDDGWIDLVCGADSRLQRAELETIADYRRVDELEAAAAAAGEYSRAKWAQQRKNTIAREDVLSFLSRKAVIPKYGFPVDVVELDTQRVKTSQARNVSLARDLAIAIGEFAPTAKLIANKREWESYGLKLVPERALETKNYRVCREHNVLTSWARGEQDHPLPCGDQAPAQSYVVPSFGFISRPDPPKAPKRRPARLFTTRPFFLGPTEIEPEQKTITGRSSGLVATIWSSVPGRMVVLSEGFKGQQFYVCLQCGAGFDKLKKKHNSPWRQDCDGTLERLSLAHEFVTDVVQVNLASAPHRNGVLSVDPTWLGYGIACALLYGLAQVVDVPLSDLNVTIGRAGGGQIPTIVLYDDVPGGAGLVSKVEEPKLFRAMAEVALERVNGDCGCGEGSSCYGCLRTYRNQFAHPHLQRGPVRQYLDWLVDELPYV